MKNFIKGILFVVVILPFLEGILSVFSQAIECICTKIAVWTYYLKAQIQTPESQQIHKIGFQLSKDKQDIDDDNEEEP